MESPTRPFNRRRRFYSHSQPKELPELPVDSRLSSIIAHPPELANDAHELADETHTSEENSSDTKLESQSKEAIIPMDTTIPDDTLVLKPNPPRSRRFRRQFRSLSLPETSIDTDPNGIHINPALKTALVERTRPGFLSSDPLAFIFRIDENLVFSATTNKAMTEITIRKVSSQQIACIMIDTKKNDFWLMDGNTFGEELMRTKYFNNDAGPTLKAVFLNRPRGFPKNSVCVPLDDNKLSSKKLKTVKSVKNMEMLAVEGDFLFSSIKIAQETLEVTYVASMPDLYAFFIGICAFMRPSSLF